MHLVLKGEKVLEIDGRYQSQLTIKETIDKYGTNVIRILEDIGSIEIPTESSYFFMED